MAGDAPIVVTGGAGLLGTAVVDALLARGHSVVGLDLRQPASGPRPGVEWVVGDVRDAARVERLVARCDGVVHLAAVVGIDEYLRDPLSVLDIGILGSRNVLTACARHRRPVLVASTSEVYGKNPGDLGESSDVVLGPPSVRRWSYASSKIAAEHYAFALASDGLVFAIARYFNVYGPLLDRPGGRRVISRFLGAIRDGEPLQLVEGGEAVRSFCYVEDAAAATVELLFALGDEPEVAGRAFNVGRREPVTIRRVAELMVELSGHRAGIHDTSARELFGDGFEEIPRRVPVVDALKQALGFEARVDLREGLSRTLSHWNLLAPATRTSAAAADPIPMVRPIFESHRAVSDTIDSVLASGRVTNRGPLVQRFESELESLLESHVAVVSSGSMALLLAAKVLELRGKVVLPAFTYIATLSAFVHQGLEPVFCDIDPETFTLCSRRLKALVASTPGISVIAPVNVYGVPPDLAEIANIAASIGAKLVYDAAHGFGTQVAGRRIPAEPALTCLSFHATKTLPAIEGGAVVSSDPASIAEVRRLSQHGLVPGDLRASTPGYNARMDELRAAVGLRALAELEANNARRRAHAERLREHMVRECGGRWRPQVVPAGVRSSFQNLAALAPISPGRTLDAIAEALRADGVEARRYFHPPLHELTAYRGSVELPDTDAVVAANLCLPLHDRMDDSSLSRLEHALRRVAQDPA